MFRARAYEEKVVRCGPCSTDRLGHLDRDDTAPLRGGVRPHARHADRLEPVSTRRPRRSRGEERHSLSDLAGLAFGLNFLMTILWLLFFGLFCLARAASPPDVKARLPDSVSGLLLHAFLASWEFVGIYGIYVGFCIVIALVYYAVRLVVRLTWQAVRRMWQAG